MMLIMDWFDMFVQVSPPPSRVSKPVLSRPPPYLLIPSAEDHQIEYPIWQLSNSQFFKLILFKWCLIMSSSLYSAAKVDTWYYENSFGNSCSLIPPGGGSKSHLSSRLLSKSASPSYITSIRRPSTRSFAVKLKLCNQASTVITG